MPTPDGAGQPLASFSPTLESVPQARRMVTDFVQGRVEREVADAAELLSSELAANAVTHAGTDFVVSADLTEGVLTVAVTDRDDQDTPLVVDAAPGATSGRGMQLVEAYSSRWGVEELDRGKRVWFQLDTD